MDFQKKYPNLVALFVGYFSEADLDNLTDEEVVSNYINDCNPMELTITVNELDYLLTEVSDWQSAIMEANRFFLSEDEIREWLEFVKSELSRQRN